MARNKNQNEFTPLPGETMDERAQILNEDLQEKKEMQEACQNEGPKAVRVVYAFCRVTGGISVNIKDENGDLKRVILKSANTSQVAPDGTRIFELKPSEFGVTELTDDEAEKVKEAIKFMGFYKKGFVFFADTVEEGLKKAAAQVAQWNNQGTEQLGSEGLSKEVQRFGE